jgi:tetratricopeptide (TPR) repeat protein
VASVADLLTLYETTKSLAEAKDALDRVAALEHPEDVELGERYDALAEEAANSDDYELAVEAQRLAIEHGCRHPDLAEDMLGWYLLKVGRRDEGEAIFSAALERRGNDPDLHGTIGGARADSGDHEGAVRAFDRAIELAEAGRAVRSTETLTERMRIERFWAEREESREDLGLPPAEPVRTAGIAGPGFPEAAAYTVAWFPREEIEAALERWPALAGDLEDPDAYCAIIERRLRDVRAAMGRVPSVAPLTVEGLVEFAAAEDLDPDSGEARSRLAALLGSRDEVVAWPPGRNDPCWCGSGRKYKRCCANA